MLLPSHNAINTLDPFLVSKHGVFFYARLSIMFWAQCHVVRCLSRLAGTMPSMTVSSKPLVRFHVSSVFLVSEVWHCLWSCDETDVFYDQQVTGTVSVYTLRHLLGLKHCIWKWRELNVGLSIRLKGFKWKYTKIWKFISNLQFKSGILFFTERKKITLQ